MEVRDSSTGADYVLLNDKVVGQILACPRAGVQS